MTRQETIQTIEREKIVVITRNIYDEDLLKLAKALYEGGIRCFEITYDPADPNTMTKISDNMRMLEDPFHGGLTHGVGTVLNP